MPNKKDCNPHTHPSVKIVVLGSSGVGKSAIVMQYVQGLFVESYDPTLEDCFSKRVKVGSQFDPVDIEILDTAGSDQFSAMRDMYIGNGDVFVLVYAVDSKASFNEACSLYNRVKAIKNKKGYSVLVGNKADLMGKCRRVPFEQASYFAHQNRLSFMEVSARKNSGISDVFEIAIKLYLNSGYLKKQPLNIMPKFEEKNGFNYHKNEAKPKKSSITKKEGHDCVIM